MSRGSNIRRGIHIPVDANAEVRRAFIDINDRINLSERKITDLETATGDGVDGDTTPPQELTGLIATKFETHIRLQWINSLSSDISHVLITKVVDLVPDSEVIRVSHPTSFYDDLDIIATSDYVYNLVVVDNAGNESSTVSVSVNSEVLPAPDAVLYKTWDGDDLETYWDPVDGFGISGYRVKVFFGLVEVRSTDVIEPKYNYTYAENGVDGLAYEVTIRVFTLDADGNPSPSYAEETITHVAPASVLNVVASVVEAGFVVSWDLSTSSDVVSYDISLNTVLIEESHTTGSYLYKTLLVAGDYSFGVKAKNKLGQFSIESVVPYTVNGPAQPATLTAQVIDNSVTLYWSAPATIELPIAEYEIRKGAVFSTAEVIGRKKGTFTIVDESIAGTYTYWVAGVDNAGNIGEGVGITAAVDEPPDYVLNVKWVNDFADGTATNYLVQADGTAIAPYDTTQTWEDHFIGTGTLASPEFADVQDLIDAGYTYLPEPVPTTASYSEENNYGAVLASSSIASTYDEIKFNGGPTVVTKLASKLLPGDAYTDQTSTKIFAVNFQYVRDKFELTSDGTTFGFYQSHTLQLDSKLKSDAGNATVAVAADGVTVSFNKAFVDITSLTATAFGDGTVPLTTVIDFVDIPNPTQFTVYIFNSVTGVKLTGTVSWNAKGY